MAQSIQLTAANRIKKSDYEKIKDEDEKLEQTWFTTVKKYTVGLPLLIMYDQKNLEFFQACNFGSEIEANNNQMSQHSILPFRQICRALCAMTCLHIGYSGSRFLPWDFYSQLPSTIICFLTSFALGLTYLCHINANKQSFKLWAWTHIFNTLLLFVHAWHFSLYWNFLKDSFEQSSRFNSLFETSLDSDLSPELQEEQNKLLRFRVIQYNMRASTAPAASIAINFLVTDWILLPRHSLIFCSAIFLTYVIYQLVYRSHLLFKNSDGVTDLGKMGLLMLAVHFTHWVLCSTQQSWRGRKIKTKDQITDNLQKQLQETKEFEEEKERLIRRDAEKKQAMENKKPKDYSKKKKKRS